MILLLNDWQECIRLWTVLLHSRYPDRFWGLNQPNGVARTHQAVIHAWRVMSLPSSSTVSPHLSPCMKQKCDAPESCRTNVANKRSCTCLNPYGADPLCLRPVTSGGGPSSAPTGKQSEKNADPIVGIMTFFITAQRNDSRGSPHAWQWGTRLMRPMTR